LKDWHEYRNMNQLSLVRPDGYQKLSKSDGGPASPYYLGWQICECAASRLGTAIPCGVEYAALLLDGGTNRDMLERCGQQRVRFQIEIGNVIREWAERINADKVKKMVEAAS